MLQQNLLWTNPHQDIPNSAQHWNTAQYIAYTLLVIVDCVGKWKKVPYGHQAEQASHIKGEKKQAASGLLELPLVPEDSAR